jgi:hypothetical protein
LEDVWSPKYEEFGLPGVITPEKGSGYEPSNYGGAGFAGKTNWDPRSARRGLRFNLTVWGIMAAIALLALLLAVLL